MYFGPFRIWIITKYFVIYNKMFKNEKKSLLSLKFIPYFDGHLAVLIHIICSDDIN